MIANDYATQQKARFAIGAMVLALASVVATRAFKAFTIAEFLAVGACLTGLALLLTHRRYTISTPMNWPHRLIVVGSLIGLTGLAVKLAFVLLGIGASEHAMQSHDADVGDRLLEHIHHLFFNLGFLVMFFGGIGMLITRARRSIAGR